MNADKFKIILLDYSRIVKKRTFLYFKDLLHPGTPQKAIIMWGLNTFVLPIILTIVVAFLLLPLILITNNVIILSMFLFFFYIYAILSFFLLPLYYLLKHISRESKRKEVEKSEEQKQLFEELSSHKETLQNFALKYCEIAPSKTIKKIYEGVLTNDFDFLESFRGESEDFDRGFLREITFNNIQVEEQDLSELKFIIATDNLEKLIDLLGSKYDISISIKELETVLPDYYIEARIEDLEKIFSKQETKYSEYLEHYVNYFGEKSSNRETFLLFTKFLKYKKLVPKSIEDKPISKQVKGIAKDVSGYIKRQELNIFENQLKSKLSISEIDKMNGKEFEQATKNLFKNQGYKTILTTYSNDQGADLILERFGEKIAVQAKRYSGKVPNKAIQEIVTAKQYYDCNEAWVVTNSYLTKQAKELAKKNNVEIIERNKLEKML